MRRNSLYLPGSDNDAILNTIGFEFLAGADAFMGAMDPVYDQSADQPASNTDPVDYTGATDIGMLARWQNLSGSVELVSQIPNLIWTDVIAQAVVGTKGVLGPGNAATKNIIPISVTPTVSRVKYHWPYAVPALLAALILLLITVAASRQLSRYYLAAIALPDCVYICKGLLLDVYSPPSYIWGSITG